MMAKHDICCIGHITLDKVVTPSTSVHMPGGTAFYFSHAIRNLDTDYKLITSLAESEMQVVDNLRIKGINVEVYLSNHSLYFENIYSDNQDHRTQRVLQQADSFTIEKVENTTAGFYHLGALTAQDIPLEVIRFLSARGIVAVDSQGYLREVRNKSVYAIDWADKHQALCYVDILKANESEMKVLTGFDDIRLGAKALHNLGVKEVLITLGSMGSVIYDGTTFYSIPAYLPVNVIDATGCGDTYMAGYLYKRAKGAGLEEAGQFGAAMATIKIQTLGPFTGTYHDVLHVMQHNQQLIPQLDASYH